MVASLLFITVYYYVWKRGIKPIHVMDAVAPTLIVGYAVGRLGCQFSGDGDWVSSTQQPNHPGLFSLNPWWAYTYPHNILNDGAPIPGCIVKHCMQIKSTSIPDSLYESILAFIILGILWYLRKRISIPGMLFYLLHFKWYRTVLYRKIRVNEKN